MLHNCIVPYSIAIKLNCALFQRLLIQLCLIPTPSNWIVPQSNVSNFRFSCQQSVRNLCLIPTSPFWIVPNSNLNVFLSPLNQLCLIPWALVCFPFTNQAHDNSLFSQLMFLPVLKLTTISMRKIVSDRQLNAIHLVERSSLKKDMATGRIMRLATSNSSIHRSQ